MNPLIFWATSPISKIIFSIDSPILEEGFRLYNTAQRHLGSEQKEGKQNIEKSLLFPITGKRLIGLRWGFSLNKRDKRADNTPGRHHARSYHRFRDILLQFISGLCTMWQKKIMSVRLIVIIVFLAFSFSTYNNEAF